MARTLLPATDRLLLTPEQVGELLNLGRSSVFDLIRAGALESVKIGQLRRIPREAVDAYVERLRDAARSAPAA